MSAPRHGLQAAPAPSAATSAPAPVEDAAKGDLEADEDVMVAFGVFGLRSDFTPELVAELEAAQRAREEAEE